MRPGKAYLIHIRVFSREALKQDQTKKGERIQNLEALNNGLQKENQELQKQLLKDQQRLQGKTNSRKLEIECNQLKQEKAKLENQRHKDAEHYHQLFQQKNDLQEG